MIKTIQKYILLALGLFIGKHFYDRNQQRKGAQKVKDDAMRKDHAKLRRISKVKRAGSFKEAVENQRKNK